MIPTLKYKIVKVCFFQTHKIQWGASVQWSFGPNSKWRRRETTTIGKTHPTLIAFLSIWTRTISEFIYSLSCIVNYLMNQLKQSPSILIFVENVLKLWPSYFSGPNLWPVATWKLKFLTKNYINFLKWWFLNYLNEFFTKTS